MSLKCRGRLHHGLTALNDWMAGNPPGHFYSINCHESRFHRDTRRTERRNRRGFLISPVTCLYVVILGLDPGIHLPMKVTMDAASSAA